MPKLRVRTEVVVGETVVFLSGPLDEDAGIPLDKLRSSLAGAVTLNLREITVVNSLGVKAWLSFAKLASASLTIKVVEVAPPVVHCMNMIPRLMAGMLVSSVVAPYDCKGCGHAEQIVVEIRDGKRRTTAEKLCPDCGKQLRIADTGYFDFMEPAAKTAPLKGV